MVKKKLTVQTSHGYARVGKVHPVHRVWREMWQRCTNPNSNRYSTYGARGIKVCDRWREFTKFLEDMGPRPEGGTLDRIDNNADYSPENCRWATYKEQARNTTRTRIIEYNGQKLPLVTWAERTGIAAITIHQRLLRGWSVEKALTAPLDSRGSGFRARRS